MPAPAVAAPSEPKPYESRINKSLLRRWQTRLANGRLYEVMPGDVLHVEIKGQAELVATVIDWRAEGRGPGDYVSVDGFPLWEGMRARFDLPVTRSRSAVATKSR